MWYKSGVSVTPEGIITSYETTSMSHRDDEHLVPLLNMQEKMAQNVRKLMQIQPLVLLKTL